MRRVIRVIGVIAIVYSFLLLLQHYSPKRLNFTAVKSTTFGNNSNNKAIKPITFIIPSKNIDLPIFPARIKNNNWETTTKGVSYLITSPKPGDTGNSILYGHNWSSLLGPLTQVRPGEKVLVKYSDGRVKAFIVRYVAEVTPDQTSILNTSNDRRITVYTCSGFLDSKRFVVVATI